LGLEPGISPDVALRLRSLFDDGGVRTRPRPPFRGADRARARPVMERFAAVTREAREVCPSQGAMERAKRAERRGTLHPRDEYHTRANHSSLTSWCRGSGSGRRGMGLAFARRVDLASH